MTTPDDVYQKIGALLAEAARSGWTEIRLRTFILNRECSRMVTEQVHAESSRSDIDIEFSRVFEINDACIALRDETLRTTGQRIWGLTFTLYPDGKYDIVYNYNKREDYDDSHEEVTSKDGGPVANLLGGLVNAPISPVGEAFLQQALDSLRTQTASNSEAWGLGTETQWNLDMNAGTLRFTFADGRVLTAPVQVVGTYNTANGTFLWGWDHPSVPEPLRRSAQRLHDYGRANGLEAFTTRSITCSEPDAWSYTAAAAQLEQAAGAYRGDAGGTWVYMVFEQPTTAA